MDNQILGPSIILRAKDIKNDGSFVAEGKNAQIDIETETYQGIGSIKVSSINIDDDTKQKLKELEQALNSRNKNGIISALQYIGDKSVDVLITLLVGKLHI